MCKKNPVGFYLICLTFFFFPAHTVSKFNIRNGTDKSIFYIYTVYFVFFLNDENISQEPRESEETEWSQGFYIKYKPVLQLWT